MSAFSAVRGSDALFSNDFGDDLFEKTAVPWSYVFAINDLLTYHGLLYSTVQLVQCECSLKFSFSNTMFVDWLGRASWRWRALCQIAWWTSASSVTGIHLMPPFSIFNSECEQFSLDWLIDWLVGWLAVRDLLLSSERLRVTIPETVALQWLVKRVDQWTERATAALASDIIVCICELMALHREKPTNSDSENPVPTCQLDQLFSKQTSPDIGIAIRCCCLI